MKHIDEYGNEYWKARELQKALDYTEWRKFEGVINKAKEACEQSNNNVFDYFVSADKIVKTGISEKIIKDYHLSRYACYLIALSGDNRKKVIALAKTYFAIQTRKQEILEEDYDNLSEDEKRIYQRKITRRKNYSLNKTARDAEVKNYDKFHNAGYIGLYNGETADDIAKRKGLRYREDILDNMGSVELVDNLFRIVQTAEKIKNDNITGESNAIKTHFEVGKRIRKTIKDLGGTMPEDLKTPNKSIKELEKEELKRIN